MARPLALPPKDLNTQALCIEQLNPSRLYRISRHLTGEPYFGRSGGNRFDSNTREYGTCYLGCSLTTALAESVLHDLTPLGGYYAVSAEDLIACYVHKFFGPPLRLANLTGVYLNRLGAHGELCGTPSYEIPQAWSQAIHSHPAAVDGFLYMSRLVNTERAIVLFDRGNATSMNPSGPIPLLGHHEYPKAAAALGIEPC